MEFKDLFSHKEKQQFKKFTRDDALRTLKLFADHASEGQEPLTSYHNGSTLVLSKLSPGTIIREKLQNPITEPDNGIIIYGNIPHIKRLIKI